MINSQKTGFDRLLYKLFCLFLQGQDLSKDLKNHEIEERGFYQLMLFRGKKIRKLKLHFFV